MEITFIIEATLLIIALLLIVSIILDCFAFYKLWKTRKKSKKRDEDSRYYELKYRIDLIKNLGIGVALVFGFFGYSTFKEFQEPFKDIQHQIDSISNKTDSLLLTLQENEKQLKIYKEEKEGLDQQLKSSKKVVENLSSELDELKSRKTVLIRSSEQTLLLGKPPKIFIYEGSSDVTWTLPKATEDIIGIPISVFNNSPKESAVLLIEAHYDNSITSRYPRPFSLVSGSGFSFVWTGKEWVGGLGF